MSKITKKVLLSILVAFMFALVFGAWFCSYFVFAESGTDPILAKWQMVGTDATLSRTENGVEMNVAEGKTFAYSYSEPVELENLNLEYKILSDPLWANTEKVSSVSLYLSVNLDQGYRTAAETVRIEIENNPIGGETGRGANIKIFKGNSKTPVANDSTLFFSEDRRMLIGLSNSASDGWQFAFNGVFPEKGADILDFSAFEKEGKFFGYLSVEGSTDVSIGVKYLNDTFFGVAKELAAVTMSRKGNVNQADMSMDLADDAISMKGIMKRDDHTTLPMAIKYALNQEFSGLDGYSVTIDTSRVVKANGVDKNLEFSLLNKIVENSDRLDAWDLFPNDYLGVTDLSILTLRINLNQGDVSFITLGSKDETGWFSKIDYEDAVQVTDQYRISFYKVNGHWNIFVNGRKLETPSELPDKGDGDGFDRLMEEIGEGSFRASFSLSTEANPYVATEEDELRVISIGNWQMGKMPDYEEGNYADEIVGKTEFNEKLWTNFAPESATTRYYVDSDGLAVWGINRETGFSVGMRSSAKIDSLDDYSITLKMPEKVFATQDGKIGGYNIYIGPKPDANFTEMNCFFIRLTYNTTDPLNGGNVTLSIFDNKLSTVPDCQSTFDAKTTAGHEREVTIRIRKIDEGLSRVYVNGKTITSRSIESQLASLVAEFGENIYFHTTIGYEKSEGGQNVGAWEDGQDEMIGFTIVSLGGKKIVNEIPQLLYLDAPSATSSAHTVTLNWTKPSYPADNMDAMSFQPGGYVIRRYKGESLSPEEVFKIADPDTLTFTDTGLDKDTDYYYEISVVDDAVSDTFVELMRMEGKLQRTSEEEDSKAGCGSIQIGNNGMGMFMMILGLLGCILVSKRLRKGI